MTIEIVDLPIEKGGSFHSYVSLPEGIFFRDLLSMCSYGFPMVFLWFSH